MNSSNSFITPGKLITRIRMHIWRVLLFSAIAMAATLGTISVARAVSATITALKTYTLVNDADGNLVASPGDTLKYTVNLSASVTDATNVQFSDSIDANTTLMAGSLAASAVAVDDTYPQTVTGNISSDSAKIPYSVTTNDYLGMNPSATISAFDATSSQGGQVSMTTSGAGMGQFTYNPPPGFEGTDTFTYTLSDNANASSAAANRTATVSIPVSGLIWFIDNNAPACITLAAGCGRLSNPFSTLAAFNGLNNGTGNNPADNDAIFIYESTTAYSGGVTLRSGQKLIGQDASVSLAAITGLTPASGSVSFPNMNSGAPATTIANAGGNGVTLNSGNTLAGFTAGNSSSSAISGSGFGTLTVADTIVNTTGQALSLTNGTLNALLDSVTSSGGTNNIALAKGAGILDGTLTISGGALTGATGNAFDANGGSANISYAGTIGNSNARSVNIANKTGGTVAFSGAISGSGTGINLSANTGANISFTGALTLSTGANPAFSATGGGIISATNASNTLTTTSGTALNVANTTIGAGNLIFRSISANGGTNGIILNTTGSSGGLVVTGDAGSSNNASGGILQNISSSAIQLTATQNVTLDQMNIQSTTRSGINGSGVTNFLFTNGTINNTGSQNSDANIAFNTTNFSGAQTLLGNNISGTLIVTGSTLTNGWSAGLTVQSDAGTVVNANISNNTVTTPTASTGAINLVGTGNAGTAFNLVNAIINQNNINSGSSGIQVNIGNSNTFGPGAMAGTPGNAASIIAITNNSIQLGATGTNAIIVANSGGNPASRTRTNFLIECNGKNSGGCSAPTGTALGSSSMGTVILIGNNGYATMTGKVNNNAIVATHTPLGGGGNGITGGNGVAGAGNAWTPDLTLHVTNNTIRGTDGNGILLVGRGTNAGSFAGPSAKLKIANNIINAPVNAGGSARQGIRIDAGNGGSADDAVCLNMSGNISAGSNGASGLGVRKQGAIATTNDFGIQNIVPNPPLNADVVSYINAQNPGGGGTDLISGSNYSQCSVPEIAYAPASTAQTFAEDRPETQFMALGQAASTYMTTANESAAAAMPANTFNKAGWIRTNDTGVDVPVVLHTSGSSNPGWFKAQPASAPTVLVPSSGTGLTLPAGKSVIVTFEVTINDPLAPVNTSQVSNQGSVSGSNFASVLTDDPGTAAPNDPTITLLPQPDLTVSLSNDASGSVDFGNTWTWKLHVANDSSAVGANFASSQIILANDLPDTNISYGAATAGGASNITGMGNISCSIVSNTLICNTTGPVSIGASGYFDVSFTATPSMTGFYLNPATTGSCKVDPNNIIGEMSEINNDCNPDQVVVTKATTTTTISSNLPNPAVVGQPITVGFSVSSGGTPSGSVTVSDGIGDSCVGTVAAGSCMLTPTSTGSPLTLTATYAGDTNFNASTSAGVAQTVNKANTTASISSDLPDPSLVGDPVNVIFSVVVSAPGAGTPSGSVTVSDGMDSCVGIVAAGSCDITLTTPGASTLTATYAGDANFNGSISSGAAHTVNQAAGISSANNTTFTVGSAGTFTLTTTGYPGGATMSIGATGALPGGVTFTNNNDGTATLAGTPATGTAGTYPITITASNGIGTPASQAFTLSINQDPAITSADTTTFTETLAGTFTVTTSGFPGGASMVISETGSLPGGVIFTDNHDGTASLAGTPALGTNGNYPITMTASNGVGADATQNFMLVIQPNLQITSADNATFMVGSAGTFTVTTTGIPAPALSATGSLPGGVTFVDNGDGTATLSGTPGAATSGIYAITITANNGEAPDAIQAFTLTVNQPAAVTSANNTTFNIGSAGTFTITTNGYPTGAAMSISASGALPGGVTFTNNNDGTATLAGTPAPGSGGTYPIAFIASNGIGQADIQSFTLTVNQDPVITSADNVTFTVGSAGSFMITTSGFPAVSSISKTGSLPGGVTLSDNGDGTATLAGTPAAGSGGTYPITVTASNGVGPDASQAFTLTVNQAPAVTSANNTTFGIGSAGTFTVTTTGFPTGAAMSISASGALPGGVTFTNNNDGTATLAGSPGAGTTGDYAITITASNGIGTDDTQTFTLTVNEAASITSADNTIFTTGSAGTFTITTSGSPTVNSITRTGSLPGGVTFSDNHNGTATLSGTPTAGSGGTYPIMITASNGVNPNATQAFTLTVNQAPAITSADNTTFSVGSAGTFTVTTTGFPSGASMAISATGGLPGGVTFSDNHDGTASLMGTPAVGTEGTYPISITANNGVLPNATQTLTLTINHAPVITSSDKATFVTGTLGSFTVTTSGSPTPVISETGILPSGVTFVDQHDGTAILSGTPIAGSAGTFALIFTASNGVGSSATQAFTLTVDGPAGVANINSVADSGDGKLDENEYTAVPITQLLVLFNKAMDAVDAANVANYSLNKGAATPVMINSAAYDGPTQTATISINGGVALPEGKYTLTVKSAIRDSFGYPLGTDFVRVFYIDTTPIRIITNGVKLADGTVIVDGTTLNSAFSEIWVTFNEDAANPAGNSAKEDVTNPANYLLVRPGLNAAFDTTTCLAGPSGDDVLVPTGAVTYDNGGGKGPYISKVHVNKGIVLENGLYKLFVCGTTSVTDLAGNPLNGGSDQQHSFTVLVLSSPGARGGRGKGLSNPATGFEPGIITALPWQPAEKAYTDLGSLWLELPSLGVRASITGAPLLSQGWDLTWLNQQVGWLEGTAFPTWNGNTVLTAHAYTADGLPGPFALLKSLKYGDTFVIHFNAQKYTYTVRSKTLVNADDTSLLTQYEKLDWVTLITCQQYDEKSKTYLYRWVVRAVLTSVQNERSAGGR